MSFDPATYAPAHFLWDFADGVATITLNRPERKNPLTFESYEELRKTFWDLDENYSVKAVVLTGAGGNFCSGGDVHEIIEPLTKMDSDGLLGFTRMTGDLVRAMRACPQPIVGRRRDPGDGERHPAGSAEREDRVPVYPRGPERSRHGRLRDPAEDHRPWPCFGTAFHRSEHEQRRRPCLGLLEQAHRHRS